MCPQSGTEASVAEARGLQVGEAGSGLEDGWQESVVSIPKPVESPEGLGQSG